jgi:hypothetical protein
MTPKIGTSKLKVFQLRDGYSLKYFQILEF